MMEETSINVQCVHGGFILTTYGEDSKVEIFTSQGKLMKALRAAIDEHSLVAKKNDADSITAQKPEMRTEKDVDLY